MRRPRARAKRAWKRPSGRSAQLTTPHKKRSTNAQRQTGGRGAAVMGRQRYGAVGMQQRRRCSCCARHLASLPWHRRGGGAGSVATGRSSAWLGSRRVAVVEFSTAFPSRGRVGWGPLRDRREPLTGAQERWSCPQQRLSPPIHPHSLVHRSTRCSDARRFALMRRLQQPPAKNFGRYSEFPR